MSQGWEGHSADDAHHGYSARSPRRVGVSRQAIIAIEGEKFDPSLPLAFRNARLFGARVEDVFLMVDDGIPPRT